MTSWKLVAVPALLLMAPAQAADPNHAAAQSDPAGTIELPSEGWVAAPPPSRLPGGTIAGAYYKAIGDVAGGPKVGCSTNATETPGTRHKSQAEVDELTKSFLPYFVLVDIGLPVIHYFTIATDHTENVEISGHNAVLATSTVVWGSPISHDIVELDRHISVGLSVPGVSYMVACAVTGPKTPDEAESLWKAWEPTLRKIVLSYKVMTP